MTVRKDGNLRARGAWQAKIRFIRADAMLAARKPALKPEAKCALHHNEENAANFRKNHACIVCGSDWPITE